MTAPDICRTCRVYKVNKRCCFQANCLKVAVWKNKVEEYAYCAFARESHNRIERMCKKWNQ